MPSREIYWTFSRPVQYISPIMVGSFGHYLAGFPTAEWTIQDIEDWLPKIMKELYGKTLPAD